MKLEQLATLSDTEICDIITNKILIDNPHLTLGDKMTDPVNIINNGKVLSDFPDEFNPIEVTEARAIKIDLKDFDAPFKLSSLNGSFLNPYTVMVNHMLLASTLKVDEKVELVNSKTFVPEEVIVTQELIDSWSYVIYRFAVSA